MAPHRRRVLFASLTTLTLALATTGPALADDDAPPAHPLAALIAGGAEVTATGEIAEVIADPSGETTWYLRAGAADVELDPMSLPAGSATGDEISATVEVPGEAIAALSLSEAAALAATSRVNAAANDPVDEATDTGAALLSAAESAGVPAQLTATTVLEAAAEVVAAPPAPSPHYLHIAFMSRTDRGKFYTSEQLDTFVRGLSSYWVRESHGVISDFVYSWDDTVAIQSDLGCTGSLFQITTAATNALGLTTAAASGAGHHVVVLSPNDDTAGCANAGTYSGVALLGSRGLQSGGYVHVFANAAWPGESSHVISHEVGHNLSLHHAGTGTCPSGTVDGPFTASGPCTIQSTNDFYGDLRNVMGWGNPGTTTLNSFQKRQLSLIDDGAGLVLVSGNQDTGYTIAPSATTSLTAAQGLKVSDTSGGINRTYYIDYDKDAGGIAIRRLCSTSSDPGCTPGTGNAAHTRILAPGTTVPFPPTQVFTSGQTMISQTGKLQVTVDGVTETDATVHIRLTDQSGVTLSATSWDPPWQGGSTTVIVTNTGGQWGASSPVSWLTVSPRLGTSGTIATISAAANLTTTPRTSSVRFVSETIAQTFTVSQAGLSDDHGNTAATATPWPLASQASVTGTLEIAADVDVFAFTAPVSGTYTFVSNATGNVTGTLQDRVGSQIATNTNSGPGLNFLISRALTAGTEYRVAIRNSSSTTKNTGAYTITATVPQPASVSVTPSSWAAPQTGAKQTVTVTTNQSSWAASSSQSWLTLSPKSGKSGRVVTLTAAFNAQSTPREAVVTFTANGAVARVTVTQRGVTDDHGSTIATATPWDIVAAPRFTGSLEIGPDVDYFAFTAPVSGQYVFESAATGNVNGYLFNSAGSQIAYNLNSGPGSNFKITYALTAGQRYYLGLRNSSQRETNTNTGPYAVAITIPPPASLSVTMTDWTTPAAGAKQAITVTTNQTKWEGLSNASWISLSPRSGSSGRSVTLTAKRNTTGSARDAVVTFTANGATAVVRVHQPAQ